MVGCPSCNLPAFLLALSIPYTAAQAYRQYALNPVLQRISPGPTRGFSGLFSRKYRPDLRLHAEVSGGTAPKPKPAGSITLEQIKARLAAQQAAAEAKRLEEQKALEESYKGSLAALRKLQNAPPPSEVSRTSPNDPSHK
eukprot:1391927-Amorphochlora_amoeboformis.AAC.3